MHQTDVLSLYDFTQFISITTKFQIFKCASDISKPTGIINFSHKVTNLDSIDKISKTMMCGKSMQT